MPKYKHGKQIEPIDFETFTNIMEHGTFVKSLLHKSFFTFLYWIGCRKAEALERVKEDFRIKNGVLIIKIPAKKGGQREGELELDVDLPYLNLVLTRIKRTRKGKRVWPFTERTAINIVKRTMGEKYYPHFLRLNRATRFLEDPDTTIPEMKAWFGWKRIETISKYVGYAKRNIREQRARLRKEFE